MGTVVELTAAARRDRAGTMGAKAHDACAALEHLTSRCSEIPPAAGLRDDARRLVRVHDLRAADASQLAAAPSQPTATQAPCPS